MSKKYVIFEEVQRKYRKAVIVRVKSGITGKRLGKIRWHSRRGKYLFYPSKYLAMDERHLAQIASEVIEMTGKRRGEW